MKFPFNDSRELLALRNRLEDLDSKICGLKNVRAAVVAEMAAMACPFNHGQVLERTVNKKKRGGSWKEKDQVKERLSITKILPSDGAPYYRLQGRLILKDGSLGVREDTVWVWENWVPEKKEGETG